MSNGRTYQIEVSQDEHTILSSLLNSMEVSVPTRIAPIIVGLQQKLAAAGEEDAAAPTIEEPSEV